MTSQSVFPAGPAVPAPHPHAAAGLDGGAPLSRRALALAAGAALLTVRSGRADAQPRPRPVANMLVYPGMILLDLTGPLTVFNIMGADVRLVWTDRSPVPTDVGLSVQPTATLAEAPKNPDILFVPGGLGGTVAAMGMPEVVAFLAECGAGAEWVTSVCTGSLLLGAAGLLRGYAATSHWYVVDQLAALGAMPRHDRVVTDRNRMTGGGVTAGLDFGLTLAAQIVGEDTAKRIQLLLEYAPRPPFDAGEPDSAGPALTNAVLTARAPALAQARQAVAAAHAQLGLSREEQHMLLTRRSMLGLAAGAANVLATSRARAAPLTVQDALGRSVTLKGPAERIVLGFNYEEFTAIAGPTGWDRVVGWARTLWTDWRPSSYRRYLAHIPLLADLPDVGNTDDGSFSLEKVLALRPDLVVMAEWSFSSLGEAVGRLEALGIPVLVIDYNAEIPERHVASTLALGRVTGNEDRARALAELYTGKLADIHRRAAGAGTHPKVYVELGQGGAGTVGNTYWQGMWGRLIDLIGATNIAAGHIAKAWGPLSPEFVLAANPDAVFIAGSSWVNQPNAVLTGYDVDVATTRARLAPYAQRQGWPELAAIRHGELHAIEHGLCRALFDYTATYYLAKQVFPDQFADVDPVDELRRYHEQFLPVAFEGCWMTRLAP